METDCPVVWRDQGPAAVRGVSPLRQLQGGSGALEKDGGGEEWEMKHMEEELDRLEEQETRKLSYS